MKIAFNPSTAAALTTPPNNKDITFDLRGRNIFARGVKFYGTDTNTWRDIKVNNVSIGSHTLDLRNGGNTTLTNTNGVVTINSTWRPVVDNLTSDSTTSSLSANQGRVLKALIDGKSNSGHTHDDRYLKLSGGTMTSDALIRFADSGSQGTDKGPQGARGGLYWSGQSDYAKLYAEETAGDNLDLVIQFGDDNSNGLSVRNKTNTQTSYISASGVITTGTFKGNLDWSYITNKPSSYTPSAHTHAWNSLTHSSTTANQAILTNGSANGWKLYTLNISAWDNAASKAHSHSNKAVIDGITSTHVSNWNTAYTFVHTITGTDTDKVINKWDEIVNFLAGIDSNNKLNTLLNSKLSVYELADKTNVGTIKNNGIYYSTTDASSGTLTNSPFSNGFALINMTSHDRGDDLRRSRLAFNAFGEIKVSDDRDQANTAETWYNVLTSKNSGISGSTIKLNGTSITVYSSGTADGRYVKKSGDTMTGALNFANATWNKVGDDSYVGDCNVSGHFGIRAANTTYPGIAFFNNANAHLGSLTAYSGNIKYGAYSLQFLDNGNTSVGAGTWTNPFSAYDKDAVKDGQAICVWGQSSYLSNLASDSGDMSLWLKRVNAKAATLNMVLDGEYYANGSQRLAHISEIPGSLKNPNAIKFRDINGNVVTYDGSAAKDLTAGTYIAKLPYGFASFASGATWGNTTGTSFASWNDSTGGSIDFRRDNPSAGKMSIKVDGRVYVNEGRNPVLSAESNNGFWGMRTPDGGNNWIRTPNYGLIPYISGNAGSGHSSLGTSGWYFSTAYIDKVYGSLKGNADTASSANKLTTARNIALGTDLRGSANFDGSGNITINANINACTVSVGSTDTLPFKRIAHFETGGSQNDNALLLYISEGYVNGRNGICRVEFRTDNISSSSTSISASAAVRWLVRNNYGLDALYAGYYVTAGKAYIDIYLKTAGGYRGTVIRVLQDSRGGINSNVQLISARYNNENDHKEAYSSIEAASTALYNRAYTRIVSGSDSGIVNYANSTGSTTKLQTARKLWGQSFDGTKDISGSLSGTGSITPGSAGVSDIGSNSLDYRYGYFHWIGAKSGQKLELGANNSGYGQGLCIDTNLNVGIGTNSPAYKLDVRGDTKITGSIRDLSIGGGIYWNPYVESATDGSDAASITVVKAGVAGGTTLVLSQQNDANDTIQFKTSTAARLYHNSNQILTSGDTKVSSGKGYINNTEITQVNNAGSASKIVNWYSARPTSLNKQFGDGSLRIFYATSTTTEGKSPADATVLHLAWDHNGGWDSQLAISSPSSRVYTRSQNNGTWQPWKTLAFTTDIPTTLKNPAALTTFGVVYDGSAAKVVNPSNFISQVNEATATITDGTMFITSYASNSGFADTSAVNVPYKRKALHLWEYIKAKTDSLYATKSHNHDNKYLKWLGNAGQSNMNAIGRISHSSGMTALADPGNTTDNPMEGGSKSTSWHLYWQTNYTDDPSGSNAWVAQIVNRAGTDRWWVRSRSGGTITNGTGWASNWRFLVTAPTSGLGNGNQPIYINSAGEVVAANSYPTSLRSPHALTLKANGTTLATYDGSSAKEANFTYANVGAASASHTHSYYAVNENYGGFKKAERLPTSGFYQSYISDKEESGGNAPWKGWMHLINCQHSNTGNNYALQIAAGFSDNNIFKIRVTDNSVNTAWRDIIHSGNIGSQSVNYANSAGNSDKVDGWHKDNIQWTGYITSPNSIASYWFKMYDITVTGYQYNDITITFLVSEGFSSNFSIFYLKIRQNGTNNSGNYNLGVTLCELVGNLRDKVVAYYNNSTGNVQLWGNTGSQRNTMNYTVLKKTTRTATDSASLGTLIAQSFSSVQTPPSTGYTKVTMSRVGSVSYSDSTGSVHWNNVTNKPGSFTPSSHTHTWTFITDKIVAGNEFNIVNAGFNEGMWFNYLPINDRNKTATISGYHFGNGAKGYTAVKASGFIKNGSNDSYVLLGGGSHKTESSLRVAYASSAGSATSATKVIVNQHTSNDTNYPLVWSNQSNTSSVTENQLYKSWADLYYNPKNKRLTVGGSVVSSSFVKSGGTNQQLLRADGGIASFNWTGQSGQPAWLWGGNSEHSYYVYNPSNFRVAYASSAGNADTLDGEHASSFVRAGAIEVGSPDLNALDTYSFIKSVNSQVAGHSPKGNIGWYNVIQLVHRNGADDGASYIGQIALGMTTNTNDMFFRGKRTDPWKTVIHSGNIGSQTVANAYHLHINSANSWSTWNWAGQSGQPSWLWGSNDGTNMYVWNPSNFNVNSAQYLRSLGNKDCQTGRTQAYSGVYTYNTHSSNTGSPATYSSVIGFGRGTRGTVEIAGGWCNTNLYWRSFRDCCEDWFSWRAVLDESNYASVLNNTYLPLAGGTMKGNARIGHGSGSLYIGNSGNDGWLYVQNMASQAGEANWKIYANGFATFKNLTVNGPTVVNGSTTLNSVTTLNGLVTNNRGILPASYNVNKNNTGCYVWGDAMSTGVTAITDALDPKYVSVYYSNDNGTSWSDMKMSNQDKFCLYANNGDRSKSVYLGHQGTAESLTQVQKNQLMVTFEIPSTMYSALCWASIDISQGVQTTCTVEIIAKDGTIKNTFTKNLYGWNALNYINFWGNNNPVVNIGRDITGKFVRFKFKHDANNTSVRNAQILKIRLFSFTKYNLSINDRRSLMAYTGHLYTYDQNLNVKFPNALNVGGTLTITPTSNGYYEEANYPGAVIDTYYNNNYLQIGKSNGELILDTNSDKGNINPALYIKDFVSANRLFKFNTGLAVPPVHLMNAFNADDTITIQGEKYNAYYVGTQGNAIGKSFILADNSINHKQVIVIRKGADGEICFIKDAGEETFRYYLHNTQLMLAGDQTIQKPGTFSFGFDDGKARFIIYSERNNTWYEFYCG